MINDATLSLWAPRVLSLLRIMAGLLFISHGLSKFFGWPVATQHLADFMSRGGLAAAIEVIGGVLVAAGLFTRIAAFIMSGEMAFAYFLAHAPRGFFPQANGGESAILFCFIFLYLAFAGGGCWSIDAARRK